VNRVARADVWTVRADVRARCNQRQRLTVDSAWSCHFEQFCDTIYIDTLILRRWIDRGSPSSSSSSATSVSTLMAQKAGAAAQALGDFTVGWARNQPEDYKAWRTCLQGEQATCVSLIDGSGCPVLQTCLGITASVGRERHHSYL
jgi:hypothetical protein